MSHPVIDELHKILVKEEKKMYDSTTLDYTPELFEEIMDSFSESWLTSYTVCGAQDPMVIELGDAFKDNHPDLAEYSFVRVRDKFLNAWNSATFLDFSNTPPTDEEYEQYEYILRSEEQSHLTKLQRFIETLQEEGDMYFPHGSEKEDEDYIANLLKAQGYWAGGKVKYFFDEDFVLIRKEERKFGE